MPGPVSDSYDPEFSTSANAEDVREAIRGVVLGIDLLLGPQLKHIVDVVHGERGHRFEVPLCEQELRVIRFALKRAVESI